RPVAFPPLPDNSEENQELPEAIRANLASRESRTSRTGDRVPMKVIAIYSIKGGVGKTAAAVNLAAEAAASGASVLLWDLDPQGASSYYFRVQPKVRGGSARLVRGDSQLVDHLQATEFDNLDMMPADFSYRNLDLQLDDLSRPKQRLRQLLKGLEEYYDYVF